jgi:protoporphyrinogen oxidase
VSAAQSIAEETRARFAILGAGPTGIGAAWRLAQSRSPNHKDPAREETAEAGDLLPFLLLDESPAPGGRAASVTTPEGFTFDYGGHVLFPHPEYIEFIELLNQVVPEWYWSTPIRGVWIANQLIPTPVQRNIHRLPLSTMLACLWGLLRRSSNGAGQSEPSLRQYLEAQFGKALTHQVMAPLNQKMWAQSPDALGSAWSSHRSGSKEKNIPNVSVRGVLRNWLLNRDETGWTSTTKVRYPRKGGVGAIWDRVFESLPEKYKRLNARVNAIDAGSKRLYLADGSSVHYEKLITSIPLDVLLRLIQDQPKLQAKAPEFRAAKVQIFGFGLRGTMPAILKGVHAISIPAPEIPFWRVNFPSNFSPGNVPDPENTWSILCESSIAPDSHVYPDNSKSKQLCAKWN